MNRNRMVLLASLAALSALSMVEPALAQPKKPAVAAPAAKPAIALKPVKPAKAGAAKEEVGPVIAYAGATVHLGNGEVLQDATVVIAGGKITQIGKGLAAPDGATLVPAKGRVITPGLVDALTSIGLIEVDLESSTRSDQQRATTDTDHAGFRAADGYNPASVVIAVARSEGLTSAGVIPTGGLISGQSAWVDLDGESAEAAIAQAPLALHVHLDGDAPGDGAGHGTAILKVREAFDDARTFQKSRAAWERNATRRFAPSRLDLEALVGALDQKVPVVFHVDRAADILAALSLAKEFKLRPVIAGGAEAWKVAPALAAAKVPVFVYPLQQPNSFDAIGAREDNAALLDKAGVAVGISTGETHNARKLRQEAGNAVRSGLPYAAALAAITRVPAEALGMGARYGTLAVGKTANLVVWSGDPLEIGTQVLDVIVRGHRLPLKSRQSALLEKYRRLPR
jgi:imidazolonepropionase-like amidohydrolase